MVFPDGEFEREVASEGAVAEDTHDTPDEAEEGADGERGREPDAQSGVGRSPGEHGQDVLGGGGREVRRENGGDLEESKALG